MLLRILDPLRDLLLRRGDTRVRVKAADIVVDKFCYQLGETFPSLPATTSRSCSSRSPIVFAITVFPDPLPPMRSRGFACPERAPRRR